ncbi:MAG: hypothetical protein H7144_02930 [Burkholderiales bacterium]|nr:hypothetical protein [Phycisphaerae bacterium]
MKEPTAVDDVRRVREKISQQHEGDLCAHVAESNRLADALIQQLKLRAVPVPSRQQLPDDQVNG